MVPIEMIDKVSIFATLDNKELEKVLALATFDEFQQGQRLFKEGDTATDMWIVIEGNVELRFEMPSVQSSTSENTLSSHDITVPESQVFGWSCFIEPYTMRLSAYCVSRWCKIVKINSRQLNELMESEPIIGYKIMRYLVQVVGFRFKQMQEEVAKFLGINMMNSW
ncbi:MAG: cyclic nucleotide-binding domain-containing protein [Pseudomonadota bacterium]